MSYTLGILICVGWYNLRQSVSPLRFGLFQVEFFSFPASKKYNINSNKIIHTFIFLSAQIRTSLLHFSKQFQSYKDYTVQIKHMKNICLILLLLIVAQSIISPKDFFIMTEEAQKSNISAKSYKMSRTVNNNQLTIFLITKTPYSNLDELKGKQAIIINSYMHARQPYSVQLAFKLYQNLIQNRMVEGLSTFLQTGIIIFYPFVNADGYEQYVKSGSSKQIRKNMNKNNFSCQSGIAGVDINRNFNSSFGTIPTSRQPCGEQYSGSVPFSEKESQVFRQIFNLFKIILAIDIHSYGNEWIYPYASDQYQQKIKKQSLYNIYTQVVDKLRSQNFTIRSCFESLHYIADGVYIDWALDQGAFSLAYEVGRTFNSDTNVDDEIQKSLKQFDIVFGFLGANIQGKIIGQSLRLKSKSLLTLQLNISFDGSAQNQRLKPGETTYLALPQDTQKAIVSVGNKQLLVFNISGFLLSSKTILVVIIVVLSLLFFLIYGKGNIDNKSKLKQRRNLRFKIQRESIKLPQIQM